MRKPRRLRPALPRVPLPRQRGGVHPDRTKIVLRKQKHRRPPGDDTQD